MLFKTLLITLTVSLGFCLVFVTPTLAQPAQAASSAEQPQKISNAVPNSAQKSGGGTVSLMSNREFWLSIVILIFGVFIILIEYFLLRTVVKNKTEEIARTYTVTLIIIGTLVLISSGFTNEQIAPALGLFGTIAGYLLGRSDLKAQRSEGETKDETPVP